MADPYGFGATLSVPYEEAVAEMKEALKAEGFGILSEIDVERTLREKLGAEMKPYVILGACHPQLAHQALGVEPDLGLLLPCNVVVRAHGAGSRVDIADPETLLGVTGNQKLEAIAREAKQRLQRALAALPGNEAGARTAPPATEVDLTEARLTGADLEEADLRGTPLERAKPAGSQPAGVEAPEAGWDEEAWGE
jgi:uncharacterized protein (DUF302 family)